MKLLAGLMFAAVIALAVSACGSSGSSSTASGSPEPGSTTASETPASSSESGETYRFVVSNNVLNNEFRPEMMRVAEITATRPPFAGQVELEVVNAESTPQAQVASVNSIIQTKPDAILIDNGAGPAMNPAIQRACDEGIVVVAFDNVAEEAPCAYNVNAGFEYGEHVAGEWLAWALNGEGEILRRPRVPAAAGRV